MTDLKQAAQQALEFLIHDMVADDWSHQKRKDVVCNALRAALAEPQTTHWEGCEAVHPECKKRVMDRELIIRLALEAGLLPEANPVMPQLLERFAALVAEHEREECAYVCLVYAKRAHENDMPTAYVNGANDCFNAIKGKR